MTFNVNGSRLAGQRKEREMSINKVLLTGNLSRDPELRRTQAGMPILNLGLAVNDRRKNQQTGEWEDYVNWVDCTMFGTRAEKLSQYLSKGSKVAIEGKLHYSSWEKDGQKRSKLDVTIDEIEFMSKGQGSSPQQGYQQSTPDVQQADATVYDDEIPF